MEPIETVLNTKTIKNERFVYAVNYLIANGYIKNQKELCQKMNISESALSNIRTKKSVVSDKTIYKLNDTFYCIFNLEYLVNGRGELLKNDEKCVAEPMSEYNAIPKWADALIQMVTEQVKANEDMRRELRQSLEEVAALKQELKNAINNLKS